MADAYTQLYIHIIIVVKKRECLIQEKYQNEIFAYMGGAIKNMGHKPIIINGMPDHLHILIGWNPAMALSDFIREFKKSTTAFINERGFLKGKFNWQNGYGAFSYSRSHLDKVYNYILTQKEHHKKQKFKEEYLSMLKRYDITYKEEYLFDFFD
ncbi:MAG: IS200/IS605 family transposase [Bacteroidales bacterium]|nr:IS200/IS605 family transposase [Bacteroidales bacterium]